VLQSFWVCQYDDGDREGISNFVVFNQTLTRLITREDFNVCIRHESFKSYALMLKTCGDNPFIWNIG
jgi:hypothetical protein